MEAIEFEVPVVVVAPQAERHEQRGMRHGRGLPSHAPCLTPHAHLTFFAGKGGVGKTTCASSLALRLAREHADNRYVIISVDPAHTLRDVFAHEAPPPNLQVEIVDTREKWREFRATLGEEIERAMAAITPGGLTVAYDSDAMQKLIEIAPPGADELFAVIRLADLAADESIAAVIVDTAPTGHFLRLLDLPRTAGEWVREFMRILLRYKELIHAGTLAQELIRASRALNALDATLHSDRASVIVVTRPEPIVVEETRRLLDELAKRSIPVGGVISVGGAVDVGRQARVVAKGDTPPVRLDDIAALLS
jgi:arsenite-transporting ATPase